MCFMIDSLIMYVMNSVCNSTYFLPDIGGISGRKRGNALLLLLFVFIFCWCHSHLFLEAFAEILRVIEAGHIGYLLNLPLSINCTARLIRISRMKSTGVRPTIDFSFR